MGIKGPEVHETQLLNNQDGSPEKQSRKASLPFVFQRSRDSECSLETVHKHGWKPLTLSAPVLFSFAFTSFLLAVIIEILAQQSQSKGGLALSKSADDIPAFANFCYLFLPTIVAVIYSLLWSWIDLDVKRMQPWLEMSRPKGATAEKSMFLDYPYDFIAFVPIKAAKRRHWAVFYGGTVMVLIFWVITPLQSAILGTGPVDVRRQVNISATETLRPASEHFGLMDVTILNEGYAQTWLSQRLPPYTTPEYTLLPFDTKSQAIQGSSTNWTGSTTKYWTQLECWPAEVHMNGAPRKQNHDFLNGRGCNASEINSYGDNRFPYQMLYIGYPYSSWVDYFLGATCSKQSAGHQFLATWGHSDYQKNEINLTAIFCEPSYYKQPVNASIRAADLVPLENSVVPLGPRERLLETEFNMTAFEHLLGAGVLTDQMNTPKDGKKEFPFSRLLEQHQQVANLGIKWPMAPMAGFAIGSQKDVKTLDVYRDEASLGNAYNSTHKMLFSLALRRVLQRSAAANTTIGNIDVELHGIIVSRVFSAVVEGMLVIVGIFTILLWFHGYRAPSRLTMDPASLGSLISLCQNSTTLLDKLAGKGALPEEDLKQSFQDLRFKLFCGCQSRSGQMVIKVVDTRDNTTEDRSISLAQPDTAFSVGHYSPVKPMALRQDVGAMVTLSMIAAVGGLVYFKLLERRNKGIVRPNASFEVLQILENYVPTIFATLLEPFWVLVNRLLCILQPFQDLWSGKRSAKGSINARYTSLPPQLVFWRAAKSGHIILTAMCTLALLSNLLAVGLGGLFNEKPVDMELPYEFQQSLMPRMNNTSIYTETRKTLADSAPYEIPFYIFMNNVSQNTPLTPWVNHDYFFQPFNIVPKDEDKTSGTTFTARTRGFSTNPSCSDFGTYNTTRKAPQLNFTMTRNDEAVKGCSTSFDTKYMTLAEYDIFPGPASKEIVQTLDESYDLTSCETPLLMGWSRISHASNITKPTNSTTSSKRSQSTELGDGEMASTFVICEPVFATAMFDVTVDWQGYIINASRASDVSATLDYPLSTNHTDAISAYVNRLIFSTQTNWHNDSFSRDWMNYLLKIQPGYANLLDPTVPPNATALIPTLEAVYRQIFVLLLGNNQNFLDTYPEPVIISGLRHTTETRIFMDATALVISLVVLAINIVVAIALYGLAIKHFLPRMPTTIGSILAYLAPSRAVREYDGAGGSLERSATFSFGRYVGEDGRAHVGIELDPFVVPVKLSALRKGDTEPRKGLLGRLLGRGKAGRGGDTWL
ncbi:hypothetical protein BDP55DRAFT_548602 [Colletotrichum godetiae]|uniref:Uncharacterized protein n=1 Tax=Colletotrichum godetiae TaxID=1209918 RepID=A0AAJ0APJ9_9PEZI|nr:uncharacterized protein BDP55DRAFT_548602 [Colletotrichum godetiae]KAK1688027.1 hypothetical protein BDP55DRAFT_548602 [Colletotrichum godetiae]